ncbi:PepSY-like domain-containing protein [Marivirga sp. S37H4]|uniref:PepSY-like domain-containing protein n=1 Tax=Marivirga aurantiaca TaxID=2802615 RepID=A0A935C5S5_9BACT|nr:PepSY-like domain-containing protein [Marivirga aurantiaca]MBK6263979.1 PepSY-like domain-containing protein [Marivirga aurantiaca]
MKKLFLTLGLVAGLSLASFAQTGQDRDIQSTQQTERQDDKRKINLSEAPQAVQDAFKQSNYTENDVKEVYEVNEATGKAYKVIVDANNKKWALKYDANGKLLETKEKDDM